MAATAILALMLVALPLAPEPYRTMVTTVFRSSGPITTVVFLGFRSEPPMPAMSAPAAVAAPKRATP